MESEAYKVNETLEKVLFNLFFLNVDELIIVEARVNEFLSASQSLTDNLTENYTKQGLKDIASEILDVAETDFELETLQQIMVNPIKDHQNFIVDLAAQALNQDEIAWHEKLMRFSLAMNNPNFFDD